ncbi:hypothetical protein [Streptomyces sp. NPDC005408]|uniref:hypothetical protein n=1 Tax=Streptomyces sp. NPDC005408 TaxID=3155341 RepID=UPI0033B9B5E5
MPLGSCSLLMALALPTVMGWIRLLALVALTALSVWLMSSRARDDIARWFRLTQIFWLALAFFEVQGWYAAGRYDSDLLYATVSDGNASMFQTLAGSLLDILQLFLMLGSLALVYVVPAAIGRWMRLRRDGF